MCASSQINVLDTVACYLKCCVCSWCVPLLLLNACLGDVLWPGPLCACCRFNCIKTWICKLCHTVNCCVIYLYYCYVYASCGATAIPATHIHQVSYLVARSLRNICHSNGIFPLLWAHSCALDVAGNGIGALCSFDCILAYLVQIQIILASPATTYIMCAALPQSSQTQ